MVPTFLLEILDPAVINLFLLKYLLNKVCVSNRFTLREFHNFIPSNLRSCERRFTNKSENGVTRIGLLEIDNRLGHVHYFDEKSGEHLGITKEKAANKCNEKGELFMVQENYELASEWFEKSYFLCELEHIYLGNKDAANYAIKAVKLENEGKLPEALVQYQNAKANCHITEMKSRFENKIKEMQSKINEKKEKFSQMWEEAWNAEENGDDEKASEILQQLLQECKHCREWFNIVSLKISGNNEFNSGIEEQLLGCQILDQANSERNYKKKMEHFEKALNHFKKSKSSFVDGFNLQSDPRFNVCVSLVQENIESIENTISHLKANAINANIQSQVKITSIKEKGVQIASRQLAVPCLGSGI